MLLPEPPAVPGARLDWDNATGAVIAVVEARTNLESGTWQEVARLTNQNWLILPRTNKFTCFRVGYPTNRSEGQWWDGWQGRYRQD